MVKDRELTEGRLVEAGFSVLATEGLAGFGVNAVARAAGCDKKLIYRYFDGPEGLLSAMGAASGRAMAAALEAVPMDGAAGYGAGVTRMLSVLMGHLAGDALAREAARVALAAPEAAAAPFRAARAAVLRDWFVQAKARMGMAAPEGVDAAAVNAVLIAGVEALAVAGDYAGIRLAEPESRARVEAAMARLVQGVYGGP
jgi:AcrR family transcriptional regulator